MLGFAQGPPLTVPTFPTTVSDTSSLNDSMAGMNFFNQDNWTNAEVEESLHRRLKNVEGHAKEAATTAGQTLEAQKELQEASKKRHDELLTVAEEGSEAAAMYHEDTMHAQGEIMELLEEQTEQTSLQHEESSQNQADMLANQKDMLSLLKALEDAQANGNAALVKKCKQEIEELQKSNENLRAKLRTERTERLKAFREKKKMEQELRATKSELARMTPQKPRRGLAPIPTNSAKPPTKRMVAAEMKHVGLKTDVALVDAEGVKRGNSSTLLP